MYINKLDTFKKTYSTVYPNTPTYLPNFLVCIYKHMPIQTHANTHNYRYSVYIYIHMSNSKKMNIILYI